MGGLYVALFNYNLYMYIYHVYKFGTYRQQILFKGLQHNKSLVAMN